MAAAASVLSDDGGAAPVIFCSALGGIADYYDFNFGVDIFCARKGGCSIAVEVVEDVIAEIDFLRIGSFEAAPRCL